MSISKERLPRLPKGLRVYIRQVKAGARKTGEDWGDKALPELCLSDLLTLVRRSGQGTQRFKEAIAAVFTDTDNLDSLMRLLEVSQEFGFPTSSNNHALFEATQRAVIRQIGELRKKKPQEA
ncbi:MAG: hypothetical protein ACOZBZ_03445 [Patescibacteria group bacterium]